MNRPKKQNTPNQGGAQLTKLAGCVNVQKNIFRCGAKHTSNLRRELALNGLALKGTSGKTQCVTLLLILQYMGSRGLNTLEGVACGFYRIATRIQELEASGHQILSLRENIIGPDGLTHHGIARYVWMGCTDKADSRQRLLDLGDPT